VVDAYYRGFSEQVTRAFATAAWGWHVETAINAIRLILAGTFERTPALQIILGHWGELVPFYLERIEALLPTAVSGLRKPLGAYFKEHFYVAPSGLWSYPMLEHAIATLGIDRLVFAIDYPFIAPLHGEARAWLERAPITAEQRAAIAHGNIEKLLKL
jgi:predicted TIM-barrel fold metal-dependent hydrolase